MNQEYDYTQLWSSVTGESYADIFTKTTKRLPDKDAIIFKDRRITFKEYDDASDRLATILLELGVKKGDRVGVLLPNCPEFMYAFISVIKMGGIVINLSTRMRKKELEYIFNDSGMTALFLIDEYGDFSFADAVKELLPSLPDLKQVIVKGKNVTEGMQSWYDLLEKLEHRDFKEFLRGRTAGPKEPQLLQYTSGTTGVPKGVLHDNDGYLSAHKIIAPFIKLSPDDVFLCTLPLSQAFGRVIITMNMLLGARLVLLEEFNPVEVIKAIQDEKVTFVPLVPMMVELIMMMVPDLDTYDLSSVKVHVNAGGPLYSETAEKIRNNLWPLSKVGDTIGTSETTFTAFSPPGDKERISLKTVGMAVPGTHIKLLDSDNREVPFGKVGEICAKGPNVMLGYWNKPDLTEKAIDKDGYYHSGDLAFCIDAEGNMELAGRKTDMIIRGGYNIYPVEIENCLYEHPKINHAALIGLPDMVKGETTCAVITLVPGENLTTEEIKEYCKENLADYKVPDTVEIVESLPIIPPGKVDKKFIKAKMIKEME
ncbi:MAG: AMP-binding protein [Thermodesulfobacteriota bacterium]|nr:AMP-binding protein [Thermodesulfobacteriota bacterium]